MPNIYKEFFLCVPPLCTVLMATLKQAWGCLNRASCKRACLEEYRWGTACSFHRKSSQQVSLLLVNNWWPFCANQDSPNEQILLQDFPLAWPRIWDLGRMHRMRLFFLFFPSLSPFSQSDLHCSRKLPAYYTPSLVILPGHFFAVSLFALASWKIQRDANLEVGPTRDEEADLWKI